MPVDHTTIYRWVQKYAPELDKHTRWYRQVPDWQASSWRVDETYIRVGGRWCYLYRAITAGGQTLDFYLSSKRNVAAAKRLLAKAVRSTASAGYPRVINTDKSPLSQGNRRVEVRGNLPANSGTPAGEIPQQHPGRRPWSAEADPRAERRV